MTNPRVSEQPSEGVKVFLLADLVLTAISMPNRIALALEFRDAGDGAHYALGTRSLIWEPIILVATSLIVYLLVKRGVVSAPLNWLAGVASFVSIYNRFEMSDLIGGRPLGDMNGAMWCIMRLFWFVAWVIVMIVEARRYRYTTPEPDDSIR